MSAIDLGDVHPLTVETRDEDGALANAGAITVTIRLPDATTVTPTPTNPTTGRYQVDYLTVQSGRHEVYWQATGVNAAAYADTFYVSEQYPRYLVSLAATKEQLKITTTAEDEKIRGIMEAATEVVERHTRSAVVRQIVVEDHAIIGYSRSLTLKRSPVISVTSVAAVDGSATWSTADLYLSKDSGIVRVTSGGQFCGHVEAIYVAGRSVIPSNYVSASAMIVEHLWQTRRGTRGAPRPGGMDDTVNVPGMGFAVPRAALELLGPSPSMVW